MVSFRIIVVAARPTWKSVKFALMHGFLHTLNLRIVVR